MAVLYRKYRPTKLADVIGQEQVTQVLQNAIAGDKIAHAFLFIGPRGTGKTSVARILAHEINGFTYSVEDNYLDIIEIDAASNTGVDNIRELREKAIIAPTKGKFKVYIIDEVHMLTKSASNALLKTLEEPPAHVIFIMATTDAHKVPITISSRTQVHTFRLAPPEVMLPHLQKIAQAEGIKITPDALEIVVRRGGGSFRDSLSLLDQIANLAQNGSEITAEVLERALGLPQAETITELLEAYVAKNTSTAKEIAENTSKIQILLKNLLNSGLRPEILAAELITAIIAAPQPALLPLLAALPEVTAPFPEAKLLLAFLKDTVNSPQIAANAPKPAEIAPKSPEKPPKTAPIPPQSPEIPQKPSKPPVFAPSSAPAAPSTPPPPEHQAISLRPAVTAENFNWEVFLEHIRDLNTVICGQLTKVDHEFDGQTLHLYPAQKFIKNILEKPNNIQILTSELGEIQLLIHEVGATKASNSAKDGPISQISAIMGNIQEVGGDSPF